MKSHYFRHYLLPAFELSDWKTATVQFNYHISVDGMLYSVPYEYIKKKVDVKVTDTTIEIFYNHNRIASHHRLKGRPGQYSTITILQVLTLYRNTCAHDERLYNVWS